MDSAKGSGSIHTKKQEFVRHEIWLAAMAMFSSHGFDETTVDMIAAEANVSRRTFFRYFSSKQDVMAAAMKGYGCLLIRSLEEQPKRSTPIEAAKAVVKRVARTAVDSPHAPVIMRVAMQSPDARSAQILELPIIEDELKRVYASRVGSETGDDLTACLLASTTLSLTTLCIAQWLEKQCEPVEDIVDRAFDAMSHLFGEKKKRKS